MRARASLSCAVLVAVAGCAAEPTPPGRCPSGADADPERSARIVRLLDPDAAGGRVARVLPTICFGTGAPGLGGLVGFDAPRSAGGASGPPVVLLDASASDGELAARLAHLVRHAEEPPFDRVGAADPLSCSRAAVRAARVEAGAVREEEDVRRELGLGARLPGEDVVRGYLARCRARR